MATSASDLRALLTLRITVERGVMDQQNRAVSVPVGHGYFPFLSFQYGS